MTATRSFENSALRTVIAVLTLVTALINLQLNFPDPVFILNGLGYLTLLAALYLPSLPRYRNAVRLIPVGTPRSPSPSGWSSERAPPSGT